MTKFFLIAGLLFGASAFAADLEERVEALEQKIESLERDTISDCRLNLRYYTVRTNNCPFDSVVKEVFPVSGGSSIRVTCYTYELTCRKAGILETIPVTLE